MCSLPQSKFTRFPGIKLAGAIPRCNLKLTHQFLFMERALTSTARASPGIQIWRTRSVPSGGKVGTHS
jgi:hypothetical protein